jgi:hypothetical protein
MFNTQAEIRINNFNVEMAYTSELIYAHYFYPVLF